MRKQIRRLAGGSKGFIGGAVAAVLVTASTGQASHLGFLGLGHTNTADEATVLMGNTPNAAELRVTNNGGAAGLRGESPTGTGVVGRSGDGRGVWGFHNSTSGTLPAAGGETSSTEAYAVGVAGHVNSQTPGLYSAAVRGQNHGTLGFGIGVWGSQEGSGYGVYGTTQSGIGVFGKSGGTGVRGEGDNFAGYFLSNQGTGVYARSGTGPALNLVSANGTAPMTVNSSTKVTNLHADKVDGYDGDQLFTSARMVMRDEFDMVGDGNVTLTMNVDPGAYVITGKTTVELMQVINGSIPTSCTVTAGSDSDQSLVDLGHGGAEYRMFLVEVLTHTFASPGTITMTCHEFGLYQVRIHQAKLVALKVGSETHSAVNG
jgi:hypothetical protein